MKMAKGKKGKKKESTKRRNDDMTSKNVRRNDNAEFGEAENALTSIFRSDELHELRKVMKTKDLSSMPLVLGAVILGKFDIVKKLLRTGHNVNDIGCDNSTPIMWAVKNKNLEMIDMLLSRGAEVNTANPEGDNILFMALASDAWDENSFIDLWNTIKKSHEVNVEYSNNIGNTLLHCAVKRQWSLLVETLLEDKAVVNRPNKRGITTLMFAAAKNDTKIIDILMNTGAEIEAEDDRGCTAICYAIANIVQKNIKPLYPALERLTAKFSFAKTGPSYENYLRKRLEYLIVPPESQKETYHSVTKKIVLSVISFFIKHIQTGLELLIKLEIFNKLKEAMEKHIDNSDYIFALLQVLTEVVRYCNCCVGGGMPSVTETQLFDSFIMSGGADACILILKKYSGTATGKTIIPAALLPIFLACSTEGKSQQWLREHHVTIAPYYKQFLELCLINFNIRDNEYHVQLVKQRVRIFKTLFEKLQNGSDICRDNNAITEKDKGAIEDMKSEISPLHIAHNMEVADKKHNAKKMRRKAKALKAKIDKIRSADMVERLNSGKLNYEHNFAKDNTVIEDSIKKNKVKTEKKNEETNYKALAEEMRNVIEEINELQEKISAQMENAEKENENAVTDDELRDDLEDLEEANKKELKNIWKNEAIGNDVDSNENIGIEDFNLEIERLLHMPEFNPKDLNFTENPEIEIRADIGAKIISLQILLSDIIDKYEILWARDRQMGHSEFQDTQGGLNNSQTEHLQKILPFIEKEYLNKLKDNFHTLLETVMKMFRNNDDQYELLLSKIEQVLLNHDVRGEKLLNDLPDDNDPFVDFDETNEDDEDDGDNKDLGVIGDHLTKKSFIKLTENLLPEHCQKKICLDDKQEGISVKSGDETPDEIYLKEMSNLSCRENYLTEEEIEIIQQKTVENAYHLVKSVTRIVESDSSISSCTTAEYKDELFPYRKCEYDEIITQAKAKFFTILSHENKDNGTQSMQLEKSTAMRPLSEILRTSSYEVKFQKSLQISKTSRWESIIRSLNNLLRKQMLNKGEIVMCPIEMRPHFIISSGGNFGDVELGVDRHARPLSVKRIGRQNQTTCRALQTFIQPLLDLHHRHILPYILCDYTGFIQDMLLVTPLCEYNMGEYLMCLKMNRNLNVTSDSLIRQMLAGLRYLHEYDEPIVHGNLKPSNVLIDIHGVVRVAEFGIHKVLYQNVRPPKSSIIWFSRETYERYQLQDVLDCSTASDIQVAGMLVHFVLTGGLHPFGIITEDILDNLVRGLPRMNVSGCELDDLISWMLVYECGDRPNIEQVLTHVYFWDTVKKWKFLLACSGISETGKLILREIDQFHGELQILAVRNNITGDWVAVIQDKFPYLILTECEQHDTPIGLLKFIRMCVEVQNRETSHSPIFNVDLKNFFLVAFPALPLSLYRLIENTDWLIHPTFSYFAKVED